MIEIEQFQPDDVGRIKMHHDVVTYEDVQVYHKCSVSAFTVFDDGEPVAAFGAVLAPGRTHAELWMLTGEKCQGQALLGITRFTTSWFATLGVGAVQCLVSETFEGAHRWMNILGFKRFSDGDPIEGFIDYQRVF